MTRASRPVPGTLADQTSSLRVGIDLVSVSDVAESVERFGDQYVRRIFTPHEVDTAVTVAGRWPTRGDRPGPPEHAPLYSYESMAARFAAKEATVKVLRPVGARPEWRDIEVFRSRAAGPRSGSSAKLLFWPPRPASASWR